MPWLIRKNDNEYCVYKRNDDGDPMGSPLGCHDSHVSAYDQLKALHANADGDYMLVPTTSPAPSTELAEFDEDLHPRGEGGRFGSGGGGTREEKSDDSTKQATLETYVAQNALPPTGESIGHASGASVERATYVDGTEVVVRHPQEGDEDIPLIDDSLAAAFRESGVIAPASTIVDGAQVASVVGGESGIKLAQSDTEAFQKVLNSEDGRRIAIIDAISGQQDRHPMNFNVENGRPIPLDNGLIAPGSNPASLFTTAAKDKPFNSSEIAAVRSGLSAAKSTFDRNGQGELWRTMSGQLDELDDNDGDLESLRR